MQELAPVAAAPVLDAESVAQEFPILSRRIGGHPLVYLDSAATFLSTCGRCSDT